MPSVFLRGRLLPLALAALALFTASTATRIALTLRPDVPALGLAELAWAFAWGVVFDAATIAYLLVPLAIALALTPGFIARTRAFRGLVVLAFFGVAWLAIVVALGEWLFWDEFAARFNFIAVDYLLYTHEVIGNIWQSYPVGRLLVAIGLLAAIATFFATRAIWRGAPAPLGWRLAAVTLLAGGGLLYADWRLIDSSLKALPGSDAATELAGNGIYEFFAANRRNELPYERNYASMPADEALAVVRANLRAEGFGPETWVDPERGGIERTVAARDPAKRLNVVLVSIESLGAEFLGAYGNPRGLTPNLDRLAGESLWFSSVYSTGNRTVRGLEALSLALPPTPGQSIVRRPKNENLFTLGSVLEGLGYATVFAYGGYSYFDNMGPYFSANHYRVVDRRAVPAARIEYENIWGVADEHLFDQVLDEIDAAKRAQADRPVFVHVMTVSNHRPYTYPQGRIDIPSGTGRDGAVKYTDYALGRFLEQAKRRAWFGDTLFVITADHGANARGTARIPVAQYRIPLFFYAPGHVPPRKVERLMSQIDIPPTILGLLGAGYDSRFMGRDVLAADVSTDRAFVANYQTLGYLRGDRIVILQPKRRVEHFLLRDGAYQPAPVPDAAMQREAIAYYQLASHLFSSGRVGREDQRRP